jgi:FdhD protein
MSTELLTIIRVQGSSVEHVQDAVAREVPLTISLNNEELVTLQCSPSDLPDLVRGFLVTAGLIKTAAEAGTITIDETRWSAQVELVAVRVDKDWLFKRVFTSCCGKGALYYNMVDVAHQGMITTNWSVTGDQIRNMMRAFQHKSEVFRRTGGVHSAALSDGSTILAFREDIGRHNAIDKVIGAWLLSGALYEDKFMLTSGRVSSEIMLKIQKCRIPIIASLNAPTDQAVKLAREMGITLAGFVRGERMNIYSCPERIVLDGKDGGHV